MRSVVFCLFTLFFILSCGSSFNSKKPIFTGDQEAFYRLDSEDFPARAIREQMPKQIPYIDLTEDQLSRVFASLSYERSSNWGGVSRRVFYNEQLRDLTHRMREVIAKLDAGTRLVTVIRHDPNRSVLSQMERTTMVSWFDETGLNIVLGEIRQEIPHNDMLERQEWLSILPVSLKRSYNDLQINPSPFYQHKKINGMTHNTWVVFPLDKIESLPAVPPDVRTDISEEPRRNRRQDRLHVEQPGPKDQKMEPEEKSEPMDTRRDVMDKKAETKPTPQKAEKLEKVESKPVPETKPDAKIESKETKSELKAEAVPSKPSLSDDTSKQLADIKQAFEQGLITQEEYEARRKSIMDRIK